MIESKPAARFLRILAALALLAIGIEAAAVTPVYKCVSKGSVTYQRDPCPAEGPRPPPPTAAQRNREQAQRAASASAPAASPTPGAIKPAPAAEPAARAAEPRPAATTPLAPAPRFSCDRRTRCAQMTSCEEARYFLANCPGAELDGDRNGIPCERQWCGR